MQEIKLSKYWTVTFVVNQDRYYTIKRRYNCSFRQVINSLIQNDRTIRMICKK